MSRFETEPVDNQRLPPNSNEAEQATLGSIMLEPSTAMPLCVAQIGQDIDVFYDHRHRIIYEVLLAMYDVQQAIDLVTVCDWLVLQGRLEDVGGLSYIAGLANASPSAANIEYYLEILIERYRARETIRIATDVSCRAFANTGDVNSLIDSASQSFMALATKQLSEEEASMRDLVHQSMIDIEAWHTHRGEVTGLSTGLIDLDRITTGLHPGDMIVIAARPAMGKTSLAMNIAEHVAVDLRLPVGVFSLEMTKKSLVTRMICSRARVNLRHLKDGYMAQRDLPLITGAAGALARAPLHINDLSGLSILGLRTRARRMHQQHGIKLLVIDYLQLLSAERGKQDNRQVEVSMISSGIKGLAKELAIPVIVLSQLNRGPEKEKNRRPLLSDLRESGSIEQDADVVGLLHTPRGRDEEDGQAGHEHEAVNLYIAKQRNGPTGDLPMTFFKGFTRFECAAKVTSADCPGQSDELPLDSPVAEEEPLPSYDRD